MTIIAFDTETKGLDWWDDRQQAFLATWADANGEYVADLSKADDVARFQAALETADVLVCHNLSFDVHQVRETIGWDAIAEGKECHDTDLMARVLRPVVGAGKGTYKLKNLGKIHVRDDATDTEEAIAELAKQIGTSLNKQGGHYDVWRAFPKELEEYAMMDVRLTFDLFTKFSQESAPPVMELEDQVAPILIEAERIGVALDKPVVKALNEKFEAEHERLYNELVETFGEKALGGEGSEQALLDALEEIGVPLYRKTDAGKLATNKFALQEFEEEFPVLSLFGDYRQVGKFLSTYLRPMKDRDVIHTSFYQCGAWTGRMSSARPNMQNIPSKAGKEVRSVFVPREGCSFAVSDYDGIEIRLLAHYLHDEGFKALLRDGHDPHAWMAAQIHGGAPEEYFKGTEGQPIRDDAKNTLFAIVYGAGAPRVADMNNMDKAEAKALISKIKASLPRYHRLNGRIRKKVQVSGYVTTLFGRKQMVKRDKAYVGLNAIIQGSAADIMKQGLVNVAEALKPIGWYPLLVVHDEVISEGPTEYADEALRLQNDALNRAYDLDPPLKVTGAVVHTNYADAK